MTKKKPANPRVRAMKALRVLGQLRQAEVKRWTEHGQVHDSDMGVWRRRLEEEKIEHQAAAWAALYESAHAMESAVAELQRVALEEYQRCHNREAQK